MNLKMLGNKIIYFISMIIGGIAIKSLNCYSWTGMYKVPVPDSLKKLKNE